MSAYNRVCSECPQNHHCLMQDDNSVEACEEVRDAERERRGQDEEDDRED